MKKSLLLILFLLVFPSTNFAFDDIENSPFKEDILRLKSQSNKFLTDDGNTFRPNDAITRHEAALMLYWASFSHFTPGYNDWLVSHYDQTSRVQTNEAMVFHDLQQDKEAVHEQYEDLVEVLQLFTAYDIFNGYPDETFGPNDFLTRGQAVKIMNAAYYLPDVNHDIPFTDLRASYYQQAVRNLYAYGIINGTSATTFTPERTVTRGEFAAILARLSKFTESKATRYVTQLNAPLLNRIDENTSTNYENMVIEKVTTTTAPIFHLTMTELDKNDYYYVEFMTPVAAREVIQYSEYKNGLLRITFGLEPSFFIGNPFIAYAAMIMNNGYLLKIEEGLNVKEIQIHKK